MSVSCGVCEALWQTFYIQGFRTLNYAMHTLADLGAVKAVGRLFYCLFLKPAPQIYTILHDLFSSSDRICYFIL